ncbi:MAG: DUF4177 domain-containing protein [Deltaproteobacteria bacterium]|nr:DUF4177 domain-containing protein [Deltaproteobacteria bacterium]
MKKFKYEITRHPVTQFHQLAFFCTENGECNLDEVPTDQFTLLNDILDERGSQGWELVQIFFNEGGMLAFWNKET